MGAHAKKSASGSKRWMGCPGSLALVASLPDDIRRPSGEAAMTGTCAHGLGEYALNRGWMVIDPDFWLGRTIWLDQNEDAHLDIGTGANPSDVEELHDLTTPSQVSAALGVDCKFLVKVDEKMIDGVDLYLETVWNDRDEMGPDTEMFVERRFDLTWLRPDMFGTSDCTLYQFLGLLRVIDYKNGYLAVDAEDNSQGLYYGLGMANEVDWLFDELEVVIVQPNSQDGNQVKRFRITKDQLKEFERMLGEASDRVDLATQALELCEDEADFIEWAGEWLSVGDKGKNCDFCDALATCPAAKWAAENVAVADFAELPPEENDLKLVSEQDLARLEQVLNWAPYLDKLVSAAKELGQRRLEQQLEVPGWKLVAGKANRVYQVDDDTIKARMKAAGFDEDDIMEPVKDRKVKSPAQLEKLGKKAKDIVNGVAEEKDGQSVWRIAPLAHKPPGKLAMAPLSDPRPAATIASAADDFEGVDA